MLEVLISPPEEPKAEERSGDPTPARTGADPLPPSPEAALWALVDSGCGLMLLLQNLPTMHWGNEESKDLSFLLTPSLPRGQKQNQKQNLHPAGVRSASGKEKSDISDPTNKTLLLLFPEATAGPFPPSWTGGERPECEYEASPPVEAQPGGAALDFLAVFSADQQPPATQNTSQQQFRGAGTRRFPALPQTTRSESGAGNRCRSVRHLLAPCGNTRPAQSRENFSER
ncbi:hypothetical protein D4764_22G0001880 [Takifugu flavidus]|uniref:Uncharacterized protein n=1 Tax=Takifugu flavidus TaxID=433684 RepID=A0A5C6NDG2_9TELE|nr:hypothetical protein D4764_22G0001880 [Takifugu flavidus]